MSDDRVTKRAFIARPEGKRGIIRPRDSVDQDAEALGKRNWRSCLCIRKNGRSF
jgi:hypothetical protein